MADNKPRKKAAASKLNNPEAVDDTVRNQEYLGSAEVKDRNPGPQIREDANGNKYDVSKAYPELMDDDPDSAKRKAQVRQNESVLDAKNLVDDDKQDNDHKHIEVEFLESGLTAQGRVWQAGQVLTLEDTEQTRKDNADANGDLWYDLSAKEQEDRYGKVFFEKR